MKEYFYRVVVTYSGGGVNTDYGILGMPPELTGKEVLEKFREDILNLHGTVSVDVTAFNLVG